MLSKTRTTIISLVAVLSVAGMSIVPTASQARAKQKEATVCVGLQNLYTVDQVQFEQDIARHAPVATLEKDLENVEDDLAKGRAKGCNVNLWREQSSGKHLPIPLEGEPKTLKEPGSPPLVHVPPPPVGVVS
jgi:hypothetical protein